MARKPDAYYSFNDETSFTENEKEVIRSIFRDLPSSHGELIRKLIQEEQFYSYEEGWDECYDNRSN